MLRSMVKTIGKNQILIFDFLIKIGRKMVYSYKELLESGLNRYQIEKKLLIKNCIKLKREFIQTKNFQVNWQ